MTEAPQHIRTVSATQIAGYERSVAGSWLRVLAGVVGV
jgi:hypothetical protein